MRLRLIGTITSADGTAKTNATTAVPFFINPAAELLVQPDVEAFIMSGVSTVAEATGLTLAADEKYQFKMRKMGSVSITISSVTNDSGQLAMAAGGAANLKVFEVG